MEQLRQALTTVGKLLQTELVKELTNQGHIASGKLANSIQFDVSTFGGQGMMLEISFLDYGNFVDFGRRKGKKRVPIPALVEWIRLKGIERGDANILRAAFAIREAIFKEGIPTKGAFDHTNNGRRTGWFTRVVNEPNLNQSIFDEIERSVFNDAEVFIDNIIEEQRKAFAA